MTRFFAAHATHPDAHMALALVAAQIDGQRSARPADGPGAGAAPTLGFVYLTDAYAVQAEALLDELRQRWPGSHWVGGEGVGVMAGGTEYFGEPALALMLCDLPAAQFRVFNGRQPLAPAAGAQAVPMHTAHTSQAAHTALVHADPHTAEVEALLAELADRTATGYLFGGLSSAMAPGARTLHIADGVFTGGVSGVAFGPEVALLSRVTQGCQPVGPARRISRVERNLVLGLDDQPALPLVLADLGLSLDRPQEALAGLRRTLVGLTDARHSVLSRGGQFGSDTRVRHLIGIDPGRDGLAIAELPTPGQQLSVCRRDVQAARRDLVRICAEIRDELDADAPLPALAGHAAPASTAETGEAPGAPSPRIAGAIYVSCSGRGGPHFGAPSAEAQIVQRALGDVPLVGFFAAGEVARHHLYGYTGVLTVFVAD